MRAFSQAPVEFEWTTYWEFERETPGDLPRVTHFGSAEAARKWIASTRASGTLSERVVRVVRRESGFFSA
jgi:hypothetical protein